MSIVTVEKNTYTVDPLYQWDKNQVLEIRGLSLPTIPEIHFKHEYMDRAIVRQASMNSAGVIRVDVPNSLLQHPYSVTAYVCAYEGTTFKTLYEIKVPVKPRPMPDDYTLDTGDDEVYSFNALENAVVNALAAMDSATSQAKKAYSDAVAAENEAKKAYAASKTEIASTVEKEVSKAFENLPTLTAEEIQAICV